jgi:hypothetical protein
MLLSKSELLLRKEFLFNNYLYLEGTATLPLKDTLPRKITWLNLIRVDRTIPIIGFVSIISDLSFSRVIWVGC